MDSLLANYASSDEEEEEQDEPRQQHRTQPNPQTGNRNTGTSLSSLPKPQFSSSSSFSALFSALPPPKSSHDSTGVPSSHDSISNPRKVVQFRPPTAPFTSSKFNDEEDDDEDEDSSRKKQQVVNKNTSAKSLIASMPAPRSSATLGAFPGSGRRAAVETTSLSSAENGVGVKSELNGERGNQDAGGSNSNPFGAMEGQPGGGVADVSDSSNWGRTDQSYTNYDTYGNYAGYAGYDYGNYYGQYDQTNWANESSTAYAPEASGVVENVVKAPGKRGRDQIPTDIVEVNQDELMKNRPREDQVKLTGIAFGPSYQPVSSVGKPSKLHKRKHQIGSLYFDLKQKEMELSERRARGMLTKAETQAKYGW